MEGFSVPMALFLSVGAISVFSFVAVATWADNRRREREAYYKSETVKKLSEMQGDHGLALLREEESREVRRRREGIKLGGLVTVAAGIGIMVFLGALVTDRPVYLVGLIPLLVGAALLAGSYFVVPRG